MAKRNLRRPPGATRTSPFVTTSTSVPDAVTHEGAPGYTREPRAELFLTAVSALVEEDSFYESGADRSDRYRSLVRAVTLTDPAWVAQFLAWLRRDGNIRTAAIVGAAEFVKARLDAGVVEDAHSRRERGAGRTVVDSVLRRADEPGELVAYWVNRYGRNLPKPVKRGVGDAILRLGTEFNYVKWDSESRGVRFADLLNLCHPGDRAGAAQHIRGEWQHDLFGYIVGQPYRETPIPETLGTLTRRATLLAMPVDERRAVLEDPDLLRRAGITWEALAGWLQGPMDAAAWTAILPSMGIMARLRNLRNLDQAGVPDTVIQPVLAQFANPDEIARSRQFPYRFYSAYKAAPSLRWGHALEQALQHSLGNLPRFGGRTLVLVDTSASMQAGVSGKSTMTNVEVAALFGVALAARGEQVDLFGFADGVFRHRVPDNASVLREVQAFCQRIGEVGHGTRIGPAVQATYDGHHRVVLISDMQTMPTAPVPGYGHTALDIHGRTVPVTRLVPDNVPVYGFNLAGYAKGIIPSGSGNRHELGGLTDATFRLLPLLEAGRNGTWPWLDTAVAA